MCANIFGDFAGSEIFKDERFLYPEYIPEKLPFREAQIAEIAHALKPALRGAKPQNLFICGKSGTGKTVTAKYVLRELEEHTSKAKGIYINCFEYNTRNAILNKLCLSLGRPVPRRGIATDEVYAELLNALKRTNMVPIVVLDEVDQLAGNNTASLLLYDLLRITEFQQAYIGIIMISNLCEIVAMLDSRVRSSLAGTTIEFQPYAPEQLKQILRERAKYAFFENALEADVINLAAAYAAKHNGDARIAIESLLIAGRLAERENAKKLTVAHLRKAFEQIKPRPLQKAAPYLDEHEKCLLSILCEKEKLFSGQLYKIYSERVSEPITERSYRKKLNRLAELKLINIKDVTEGIRGRTREITLAQPKKAIEEILRGNSTGGDSNSCKKI
ncbi:MAG: AAA family ATPase [Candidatus Diapherotrites archaeon]|nr:AAA family ATPase [Candidatus Diapherotrites archaeon]